MDSSSKLILLPLDRMGFIAHSILLKLGLQNVRYAKVFSFLETIEGYLLGRGYVDKDGVRYAKFTPSEVRFLKTLYNE